LVEFDFSKNEKFHLCINNYQYPDPGIDSIGYDRNWLSVYIKVETSKDSWESQSPSLLTWELEMMINEFKNLKKEPLIQENNFLY